MLDKQGFYHLLDSHNINYESIEHPAVYTMEEIFSYQIPHTEHIVKNLFLRDDKKRNYYLVTIAGTKSVDLRSLSETIPSRKLSFASEKDLVELLRLEKGHVNPMGVFNNIQQNVTVVFDKDLVGQQIGIHPMENTATVFLEFEDVKALITAHGSNIVMCDVD
ncbi:prolyl-tRNA synthetase associated domain-containing protein [Paenibacillus sp. ACRSA]|uniref:prolyl-tRNA synthetase associated domain-containing protein n=1 Tax=Paenibacillus sp. ACRSA TaxID=2918211 RepID=UPI001EF4CE58|nr:prolyl-tRNA synthetase associated domain-containing protein [Paenibacillus sp. ACRSA]MCG7377610.1 prolyl-tRNA synthetase associated domain-containing protein [Paenibacillus sp. ACRSA]